MWISNEGQKIASPLRDAAPLHGGMTDVGMPVWFRIDGNRRNVVRRGMRWLLADELGRQGVAGEAWVVELDDGSFWWAVRDLMSGKRWLGEPVESS